MKKKHARVARTDKQLFEALLDHLEILKSSIQNVKGGDFKYLKILASTLRVLVHRSQSNKPLLIDLANKFSVPLEIKTDNPWGVEIQNMDLFLEKTQFSSGTKGISLKTKDIIAKYSQQEGGSHEDWEVDKDLLAAKGEGILLGGLPPMVRVLTGIGECILQAGEASLPALSTHITTE